jgi:7-cyano-7-deazaguanine synthase
MSKKPPDDDIVSSQDVVLFSGGIDSAVLAKSLIEEGISPDLLFVQYGQPARQAERRSALHIARTWSLALTELGVTGLVAEAGEIAGRNAMLVHLALARRPDSRRLHLGIHAGTGYRDCGSEFVEAMQRSLDLHTDGRMQLSAPFVEMTKQEVVSIAKAIEVPLASTYSCEAADTPCGTCASCRDRAVLDVR